MYICIYLYVRMYAYAQKDQTAKYHFFQPGKQPLFMVATLLSILPTQAIVVVAVVAGGKLMVLAC